MKDDRLISLNAAMDALEKEKPTPFVNKDGSVDPFGAGRQNQWYRDGIAIMNLPSAQPEQTDCEYCHEDSDGYVRSIEKNSHAWLVRRGRTMKLRVGFKGEHRECDILFCPMCGRRLTDG